MQAEHDAEGGIGQAGVAPAMPEAELRAHLTLHLASGIGPVLSRRLIERFGSCERVLGASPAALQRVEGIGDRKARAIADAVREAGERVERELSAMDRLGVRMVVRGGAGYPALLSPLDDAPLVLFLKGEPGILDRGSFPVALVGSRRCSAYGIEQAERFAGSLAQAGLTIVSGGARGIDTAAHRAALRVGGRTAVFMGCGLGECYPPDNRELFAQVVERGGVLVSELASDAAPEARNFPARNRLISGVSLGVLVIEAGLKSGALITAKVAGEEHGREVMALPGRVDSLASRGSLDLLKQGGAILVTEPGDVIAGLEGPARHHFADTFAARYPGGGEAGLFTAQASSETEVASGGRRWAESGQPGVEAGSDEAAVLGALGSVDTMEGLVRQVEIGASRVGAALTLLEIRGLVRREGGRLVRTRGSGS
ncbi:MAG: DNA-processing protein DprA [Phycisphaerales bacterium JB037]